MLRGHGCGGICETFIMAKVILNTSILSLVLAQNKPLAMQLCNEPREFFLENATA